MATIVDRRSPPPAEPGSQPAVLLHALALPSDAEFRRLQDTDGSVRGYELDSGRLVPMPPVHGVQGRAWGGLYRRLGNFVEEHSLGEVLLDQATYLGPGEERKYFPDIVYLSPEDLYRFDGDKIVGPPTMVCEVTGETSWDRDHGEKRQAYYEAGVPWYWIVDLVEQQVKEFRRGDDDYEPVSFTSLDQPFRPALFPGLAIVICPGSPGGESSAG